MELRQLEYFVAVAEERSFTRGAERAHVAQPGVSAQIRRLERELGEPLLDRSARTVRLTAVGEAVLPYAEAALQAVAGARLAVDEQRGLLSGRVAVGMVVACGLPHVPDLLEAFHAAHPAVEIALSEANSDDLVDGLRAGRLDLALVGLAGERPDGIDSVVIIDEPLVAAVPHGHPLAPRTSIGLRSLARHAIVSMPRGTGVRAALDHACTAAGIDATVAFEAGDPRVVAQLATRGLGVAVLPASVAHQHREDLHALAITRPRLRSRMEIAWRAGGPASPAARALIAHVEATTARDTTADAPADEHTA
jgi:DNA-binding transcriptional LysR family regulator